MTTSQAFPTRIGKITLKDRKGPIVDRILKNRIRVSANLMAASGPSSKAKTKAALRAGQSRKKEAGK